jgi:hypothetical protein
LNSRGESLGPCGVFWVSSIARRRIFVQYHNTFHHTSGTLSLSLSLFLSWSKSLEVFLSSVASLRRYHGSSAPPNAIHCCKNIMHIFPLLCLRPHHLLGWQKCFLCFEISAT